MAYKLKVLLRVLLHTFLSFIAALCAGFIFYAYIRPIVGNQRYRRTPDDPIMIILLLFIVLLEGAMIYRRWPDRCAFFAWIFQGLWICHLALTRGLAAMEGRWSDPLFLFGVGAAYSLGALIAALGVRKRLEREHRFPPFREKRAKGWGIPH